MSAEQVNQLELRARAKRDQLHNSATELKEEIAGIRERLDATRNIREHFSLFAGVVAGIGLLAGYAVTGAFLDR